MVEVGSVVVCGEPKFCASSKIGRRSFCAPCGGSLFFTKPILAAMGMMQVGIAARDAPCAIVPQFQVQAAGRIEWMPAALDFPAFERFPA